MGVEIGGLDELRDQLDDVAGGDQVSFGELFDGAFMRRYTDFNDLDSFFEAGGWEIEGEEDFEAIPDDEFDDHVDENTRFNSWDAMLEKAASEWMADQLGL
ncbi:hypothetical protein C464_16577 [Halorubrum coriense DSM 10284]|uniref:Uncharacterized protein n=1 Tax=Halorubrum coriense DSM 10284 TaxID=1227466 RepID=M0E6D1_9EURY|nr:hypothetical protein [Halorubrum coriense]ELZ43360.1 hypothetical protein C464_16577 [Halorubrum coriense DSM 10284]